MSSSFPVSREPPSAPFGRPSVRPEALALARPSTRQRFSRPDYGRRLPVFYGTWNTSRSMRLNCCPSRIPNSLAECRAKATLRAADRVPYAVACMEAVVLTLLHLAVTAAKLCRPGGVRAVIAENLLLKQ